MADSKDGAADGAKQDAAASHAGHRERLRRRYIANGLDGFSPYEALELLLFRFIPRVDTNPVAHALIDRFGSFENVFAASEQELYSVKGVTKKAANAIVSYAAVVKGKRDGDTNDKRWIGNATALNNFAIRYCYEQKEEYVFVLMNEKNYFVSRINFPQGMVNEILNDIYYRILDVDVKHVALVRFTSGEPQPSALDKIIANNFEKAFGSMSVYLIETLVIGKGGYYSYRANSDSGIDFDFSLREMREKIGLAVAHEDYDPFS